MLRSPRIFLGGQGGLVGPVHIDFGTVLAAGFVYRKDHGPNEIVVGEEVKRGVRPLSVLRYDGIQRRVRKNLEYIGNLVALWCWYEEVRLPLAKQDQHVREVSSAAQRSICRPITTTSGG